MKKILISYASYGGGHLSAAKNVKEYIEKFYPDYDVILFDCMKYINKVIDKVCGTTYSKITTNIPWFWGKIYYHTQEPIFERILSISNRILSYKLGKLLKEVQPDIIISTHFFVSHMCSILKQKGKITAKLATIITDYGEDPYNEWISNYKYVDYIFVAHNKMKIKLIEKGVPENKVFDTGIPISIKFLEKHTPSEILNDFYFTTNKKIVLFFGGGELGLGKSKTLDIFEHLITNFPNIQVIAIAGKNENLKISFEKIVKKSINPQNIKVLGFTDKVAELMSISNLVISKPGGLTTTECLVSNVPMLAINPLPGQEEDNAKFLEENDVAIWIKKNDDLQISLESILKNDENLLYLKNNIKNISKPNSTKDICNILFN